MERLNCIVHYPKQNYYQDIKKLSDGNIHKVKEAKTKREEIGGLHLHDEQIQQVPTEINNDIHGVHMEPCYKRFTAILSNPKFKKIEEKEKRKSDRLSSIDTSTGTTSSTPAWIYPKNCNLCGKYRIQHLTKKYEPYTITTYNAATSIKTAAKNKNQKLYQEIEHLDLIAKEFKVHKTCYKTFTLTSNSTPVSSSTQNLEADLNNSSTYDKGHFDEVKAHITDVVLNQGRVASMKTLHQLYNLGVGDCRYRNKLKKRIAEKFGNQISFLSSNTSNLAEVVVSSVYLENLTHSTRDETIKSVAQILKDDIIEKFKDIELTSWPPSTKELASSKFQPPESLNLFLKSLLSTAGHSVNRSSKTMRTVDSIAQDIVSSITKKSTLQLKHVLLALGLHTLTGSRKVVDLVHKFGHCMSYNLTCEVETAQAEQSLELSKKRSFATVTAQTTGQ